MSKLAGKVQTVLGLIEPSKLGITLMHEHFFIDVSTSFEEPKDPWERRLAYSPISIEILGWILANPSRHLEACVVKDVELAMDEAIRFREAGGGTVVDVTPVDIGRYPEGLKVIAEKTGINVVCGTAHYVAFHHPPDMDKRSVKDLKEEMVREIMDGIDSTGIKAGIIGEIGNTAPWHENERKVCRAAAMAQAETGAAVTIHPGRSREAPVEILKLLKKEGADLEHVVMGHLDRTIDKIEEFKAIARYGCYLELDLFGYLSQYAYDLTLFPVPGDEGRAVLVKKLIDAGYLDKLLISHDMAYKFRFSRFGGYGLTHLLKNIKPRLNKLGVSDDEIRTMLVENPKKVLPFKPI